MKMNVEEIKRVKLTYGKHKGSNLIDVPTQYLEWLQSEKLTSGENTSSYFMQCLDYAIKYRSGKIPNRGDNDQR